jgi:diaminopimelate decarboxylase
MTFTEADGVLQQAAARFGTPAFVYVFDEVIARVARIRAAFGGRFGVSYAAKANPNHTILQRMAALVDTLDISSGGELERALAAGWVPARISFTGPAKRTAELAAAVTRRVGEVVVESLSEARELSGLAVAAGVVQPICVRIAPAYMPKGFGVRMSGRPSQFGVDEEDLLPALDVLMGLPGVALVGLHIYAGTQCLKAEAIAENFENFARIFRLAAEHADLRPKKLIFGGGLGIRYYERDAELDLEAVGAQVAETLDALKADPRFAETALLVETGRYLVGEAGWYLAQVVRTKHSRGTEICLLDGGMNHHLGAAGHLGTVIHRNYRHYKLGCPEAEATEQYELVGPLCTTIDTMARRTSLPPLAEGDVVVFANSGAYGLTSSPLYFISHPPPVEVLAEREGAGWRFSNISEVRG